MKNTSAPLVNLGILVFPQVLLLLMSTNVKAESLVDVNPNPEIKQQEPSTNQVEANSNEPSPQRLDKSSNTAEVSSPVKVPAFVADIANTVASDNSSPRIVILSPTVGTVLDAPAATVVIQMPSNTKIELLVNGKAVDPNLIGRSQLDEANKVLGLERGEAPDAVGTGNRFSHLMAIAPNASSSILMGNTSPSIEPYRANAYRQDTLSGSHLNKNRWLDKVIMTHLDPEGGSALTPKGEQEYADIWSSIIANDGSVQHLDWMDDWTKDVFKTSMEIDQRWLVQHAADRQEFIDQAQSLNVFFRPDSHIKYIHAVHFQAWKQGLKTMYYCRSDKIAKADKVSKRIEREVIKEIDLHALTGDADTCLACEG